MILIIVLCTCYVLFNAVHNYTLRSNNLRARTKIAIRNYYMLAFKTRPTVYYTSMNYWLQGVSM